MSTIELQQFVNDNRSQLLEAVKTQCPPRFLELVPEDERELMALHRRPYPAQMRVIQAIKRLLVDDDQPAGIINAEMGTGKTLMGIGVSTLCHKAGYKRSLIICPPHLVYKWRREIVETVPNACVFVLNGSNALRQLQTLREQLPTLGLEYPTFFIIGRVRLRLGHSWKPAFDNKRGVVHCPRCGEPLVNNDEPMLDYMMHDNQKRTCACGEPLWQLVHRKEQTTPETLLMDALTQLPTIGKKKAEDIIARFGQTFLTNALSDNIHQFVNLMDENGEMVFSDKVAKKLERTLSTSELNLSTGGYQLSEYLKRYFPSKYFGLLIVDEAHEYKNNSAQGMAMATLASSCAKKTLLLTGTLMGGYADDLFYLLFRIMPQTMIRDGYHYNHRGSLHGAIELFMKCHGVLVSTSREVVKEEHFKTARGKRSSVKVKKAPGISPQAIMRYILPYTAFLRLAEIGHVLPPYEERMLSVPLSKAQKEVYSRMECVLKEALKSALGKGQKGMISVVVNALLSFPETAHTDTRVRAPNGEELFYAPSVLGEDEPSPKEQRLIEEVLAEKAKGRKSLVYVIYTETRDITPRIAHLLQSAGVKVAVLKSSVTTDKREQWIEDKVEEGVDVIICHPKLVETGLDLLDFPNIFFMQTGYNVYTLMQAAKRSWRIGQTQPVTVNFLGYEATAQAQCLQLMQKKITVTKSASGVIPECGLDVLNQSADSIEIQLARSIVSDMRL